MIRYNEPGTAKGSDPLPVGQAQCVLAGLAFSKAPLWCPTHGRWHGGFDLRRDKVVAWGAAMSDPRISRHFADEASVHWTEVAEAADLERAILRGEEATADLAITIAGLDGAALLGLPPEAGPLVAAVIYSPDLALRKTAADAIIEFLDIRARVAA